MLPRNTIAALKENDEIVFNELFNDYHHKVYFYILAKTKSDYLAEEVTQLAFIKLWDYRHNLDETLPVSSQIFRIAKTTCIDLLRKEANQAKLLISGKKDAQPLNTVSDLAETKEMERRLSDAVQKMPPVRRKVFQLSRYESKSYKEISQLLSLSEKTVENHIALAIKQLRRIFFLILLFWV